MITRILVPIDRSEHSSRAATFATELAIRFDASVTFIHVLSTLLAREQLKRYVAFLEAAPYPDPVEIESVQKALSKSGEEEGIDLLDRAKAAAAAVGVQVVDTSLRDGDPATVIVHLTKQGEYDLVVLGRRGMGRLKGLLTGSVSQRVASAANCTVVTVS